MDLRTIQHELIANRTADAWFKVPGDGPAFHYRWQYGLSGDGRYSYVQAEHHSHAVSREEPGLTVSWGMAAHEDEDRYKPEWAEKFINPSVSLQWADFFWHNALVDRVGLVVVDGAHGLVPQPGWDMEVTEYEVAVAHLIHDLDGSPPGDHPSRYLDIIGAKTVYDQQREGAGSSAG